MKLGMFFCFLISANISFAESPCVAIYAPNSLYIAAALPILEDAIVDREQPDTPGIDDVKSVFVERISKQSPEGKLADVLLTASTVHGVSFKLKMKQDCRTGKPVLVELE